MSAFSHSDYLSDMECARISRIAGRTVRTMTLEQAIASYEQSAERYHKSFLHCKAHGGEFYQEEAESNKICYEHDRQLAAWLRELQERREEPEIVTCYECKHYLPVSQTSNSWGKCSVHSSTTKKQRTCQSCDYCSWAERRTE